MGRIKTIDVDRILDAAEAVVVEVGAHRLTLNLVAEKAGISRGGLAYSFKSKEELISAMSAREMKRFVGEVQKILDPADTNPLAALLARIAVTRTEDEMMIGKAASMAASLLQAEGKQSALRKAYREELDSIGRAGDAARRGRVAFWALEGIFLLRGLGFLDIPKEEWEKSLDEIRDICNGRL